MKNIKGRKTILEKGNEREMTVKYSAKPELGKLSRGHFGDNWGNMNMEYILDNISVLSVLGLMI